MLTHRYDRLIVAIAVFVGYITFCMGAQAEGSEPFERFYVRPNEKCLFHGDGTMFECAKSAGAPGAFRGFSNINGSLAPGIDTVGSLDQGDTLILCGEFGESSEDYDGAMLNPKIPLQGSPKIALVVSGDCTSQGVAHNSILDGEGRVQIGIGISGNYLRYERLTIRNFTRTGIYTAFDSFIADLTIADTIISHVVSSSGIGQNCIEVNATTYVLTDIRLSDCGNDGIFIGNGSADKTQSGIVRRVEMLGVSTNSKSGDGIQQEPGGRGNLIIEDVKIYKAGSDKACALVGGAGVFLQIDGFECRAYRGGRDFAGITLEGCAKKCSIRNVLVSNIPGGVGIFLRGASSHSLHNSLRMENFEMQGLKYGFMISGDHRSSEIFVRNVSVREIYGTVFWIFSNFRSYLLDVTATQLGKAELLLLDGRELPLGRYQQVFKLLSSESSHNLVREGKLQKVRGALLPTQTNGNSRWFKFGIDEGVR